MLVWSNQSYGHAFPFSTLFVWEMWIGAALSPVSVWPVGQFPPAVKDAKIPNLCLLHREKKKKDQAVEAMKWVHTKLSIKSTLFPSGSSTPRKESYLNSGLREGTF